MTSRPTARCTPSLLRPNARFHDGSPVRAIDVVYSMERLLALKLGPYRLFSDVIAPGGARAINERTVAFNLVRPMRGFDTLLPELAIVNRALVSTNEKNNDWGQEWLQRNSAGSGSYIPFRRDREGAFLASRFHEHFIADWGPNAIDEFEVHPLADPAERVARLLKGKLNGIVGHHDCATARRGSWRRRVSMSSSSRPCASCAVCSTTSAIRPANIDFRRALAHVVRLRRADARAALRHHGAERLSRSPTSSAGNSPPHAAMISISREPASTSHAFRIRSRS